MGYPTNHKLTIVENRTDESQESLVQRLEDRLEDTYCFSEGVGKWGEARTWYSIDEDMRKISKEFKDVLILIDGEGEGAGDIWKRYFLNGKTQYIGAVIKFEEEFDEGKLK